MYPDAFLQEAGDEAHAQTLKEHETERKKLVEELGAMRQTKVVVYFICGAYVS
jgi:hypothetical protein